MTFSRIMRAHQVQGPLGFLGDRRNDQCGGNPDNQRCGDDDCDDGQDTAFQLQLTSTSIMVSADGRATSMA